MSTRQAPRLPVVRFLERRTRRQIVVAVVAIAVAAAWFAATAIARIMLDRWWLESVTDAPVWSRRTIAQLQLGFGTAAVVAIVLGGTVRLVATVAATTTDPLHRFWTRYHERVGPAHRWGLIALVAYLTWHIGRAAGSQWQVWLLFRHGHDVGVDVPRVGGDLGFHIFRLPFLVLASSFLRQITLLALVLAVFGHAASGALRIGRHGRRSHPAAVTHLGILATVLLALQAAHQVVVARALTATNRVGAFDGAGFTEIEVTRPALMVAAISCLVLGFVLLIANRSGRWRVAAVVAVAVAAIQFGGLVAAPIAVEALLVAPAEAERQLWSIDENLAATRVAYGIDDVTVTGAPLTDGIGRGGDEPRFGSERGIPLFPTASLGDALQVLAGTPGTRVRNVDLAAYEVDGVSRPVYTAARPSSLADLPEQGWVQQHLVYTHGDGVVSLAADVVDADGRPDVTGDVGLGASLHRPLYYGEGFDGWYAITDTRRAEADGAQHEGPSVAIGSLGRRAAVALALGEPQPLLSSELTGQSRLLFRRSLTERIAAVAPFLRLDRDPYVVLQGDDVTWVVDAYTTASTYPYAQFAPADAPPQFVGSNYVQASVIATVDAIDGTVHLYRADRERPDPVLAVWTDVFPGLLEPLDAMPRGIADHVRYPEDLFALQTSMLGRYHVTDAETLFGGTDRWTASPAAATTVGADSEGPAPAVDLFATADTFQTVRTFGPGAAGNPTATRDELTAMAVADHALPRRLSLIVPDGPTLLSPQVAQSAIDADPEFAQDITLLNANGSHVEFGPMTPVLVGDGVLWARPIIVIGTSPAAAPRLYGVAVVSGGVVAVGPTVGDAIETLR